MTDIQLVFALLPALPLAQASTGLDLWSLVSQAGPMGKLILLVLAVFSVISWGIVAERFVRFRRAEGESRAFLGRFQEGGGLAAIQDATAHLRASPTESRIRLGGAVSLVQRARRSHEDSTPPKLVPGRILRAAATTASASSAEPSSSKESSGPNPPRICERATASVSRSVPG